jgi:hypothetical protein
MCNICGGAKKLDGFHYCRRCAHEHILPWLKDIRDSKTFKDAPESTRVRVSGSIKRLVQTLSQP